MTEGVNETPIFSECSRVVSDSFHEPIVGTIDTHLICADGVWNVIFVITFVQIIIIIICGICPATHGCCAVS
jgi:hypothetical protein